MIKKDHCQKVGFFQSIFYMRNNADVHMWLYIQITLKLVFWISTWMRRFLRDSRVLDPSLLFPY